MNYKHYNNDVSIFTKITLVGLIGEKIVLKK